MTKSKLIYIVSTGHSGSTLTDMWIGKIKNVFSTGEIVHLPWQIWRGENLEDKQTYCSCGNSFETCNFWDKTFADIKEKTGQDIYKEPMGFDTSIHTSQAYDKRSIIHSVIHIGLLKLHRYLGNTKFWDFCVSYYQKSIENNWQLYDSIAKVSGSEFVTDSSKNFLRYLFLKSQRPDSVKLIILFRNVHGVASSSHHGLNESVVRQRAKDWENFYTRVGHFLKQSDAKDYYLLNYERMCAKPEEELMKMAEFIGVPEEELAGVGNELDTNDYHLVAGNPIRHQGKLSIRYDQRWKERLTADQVSYLDEVQKRVENSLNISTN